MEIVRYQRKELIYEDVSSRFKLVKRIFNRQYAHIYAVRLMKFKPLLEQSTHRQWGTKHPIKKLVELIPNEKAVVFGTLYKQQELKPNILREISDEHQLLPLPGNTKYTSETDVLILEDELQRIQLTGNIEVGAFVTGVVLALLGYKDDTDKFFVEEICPAHISSIMPEKCSFPSNKYVAFISGLDLGSGHDSLILLQEMIATLMGKTGTPAIQEIMSNISRIIIAGNSLSSATQDRGILDKAKYLVRNNTAASIEAIQQLDDLIFQLASSITVDLMPGAHDPSNFFLPQQPLHHCLLQESSQLSTFHPVTNPYCCKIGGRLIMGSSGQPISDILMNSTIQNSLDAMEKTLEWSHLCPSAPDTLGCYPYTEDDPFVIENCPDIYFAGNQTSFDDRLWTSVGDRKVRLISLPRFSESGTIVVVNIGTLECFTVSFGTEEESIDH